MSGPGHASGVRSFTTADGLSLAFAEEGKGLPVLCLAGLTRNMDDFEPVLRFADRARIIRLDSRGRGRSEFDRDWRNYTVLREAEDAVALLDHLGIDRAAILGTSRGGLIAMSLAAGHGDRLRGVMLNDIGPVIEPAGLAHILGYIGNRPGFADHEEAAARLADDLKEMFPGLSHDRWLDYARRSWRQTADGLDLLYDPNLRQAMLEPSQAGASPDLWPLFRALDGIPTALLRGANSNLLSAETAARMQAAQPGLAVTLVPDRGHVPFLDEPQSVAAIADWLKRMT